MLHTTENVIRHKIGLLNLAEELDNVSRACKIMGVSRDTFYRYKEAVEDGGVEALIEESRRKPNPKNRIDQKVEQAIVDYALEQPAHGQVRASNELRKRGIFVSPTGVRGAWLRHDLETFKKRLKALESKAAAEGWVYTEAQIAALEKRQQDREAGGEIETHHPGYLGSQDTYYVGAKLYTTKTPITSADVLNDRVLPLFLEHELPLLRILTDRGTEYCGRPEQHDYQLYLAINDIDHTRTKAKSPQTNGICERFHKTVLDEFYRVAFRKKIYEDLESLQRDLDEWLHYYNHERTHQGKMCCGRTPMETLEDGKKIWQEKKLN